MSARYAKHQGITLAGAGELRADTLTRALRHAPHLVAADGGADRVVALGHRPDLVVGDLDSVSDALLQTLTPRQLRPVHTQDDTDFDKALDLIDAPFILATGFSGARLDHTLASMNTLVRHGARKILVDTGHDLCCVLPPALSLVLAPGTRVSLFPMGRVACTSTGLHWPVDGLRFDPGGKIGTSNIATGGPVRLTADAPLMLLLLPEDLMDAVLPALLSAPSWPPPARAR